MPDRTSNAAKLREFHRAIDLNSPSAPSVPDLALLEFREALIREEGAEVQEEFDALRGRLQAGEDIKPAELAPLVHELTDLLYVTYGALDQFGIDTDAVFAEVHRVNMQKTSGPKRADGKQLKPEGWQPANVRRIIEEQGKRG